MALPWVKLHTGVLDNDRFRLLSPEGRYTFLVAIALAGKLDADGALMIEGFGPVTADHVSSYTGLKTPAQARALHELVKCGLLLKSDADGALSVAKWDEKAGDESRLSSSRERSRRYRVKRASERSHNALPVTQNVTDKDREEEVEVESDAIASPRPAPAVARRQPQLDLRDHEAFERRNELLTAVWELLGGLTGTSKTAWASSKGNRGTAFDMAKQGVTVDQVTVAWRSASARFGEPVYTMKIVQEEIAKLALVPIQKAPAAPAPRRANDPITPDLPEAERLENLRRLANLGIGGGKTV